MGDIRQLREQAEEEEEVVSLDGHITSQTISLIVLISAAAVGSLFAAVRIFCIFRRNRKTDQEVVVVTDNETIQTCDKEIVYADPTFYKRNKQKRTAAEEYHVEYAPICIRK
ncbi:hypothetical protein G5714_021238 [Onychostoma macrolepis]|uniref:Uncharacterized protein n=1 Tax=Onychostoma macrolepis TaxID=369639 RepID=A0A7J6BQG8_9TELE|nr:hypothetical protein G5714_021238 [Onychostoma macrolepis]